MSDPIAGHYESCIREQLELQGWGEDGRGVDIDVAAIAEALSVLRTPMLDRMEDVIELGSYHISAAISLKRIADALAPTEGLGFIDKLESVLNGAIENAAGAYVHRDQR